MVNKSFSMWPLAACALLASGAAQAQLDLGRSGPIQTLEANPKPVQYVSQALARNLSATSRYFDDVYALGSGTPSNLSLVADPAGSGRKVFRMELRNTDALVSGGSRTEITPKYEYVISGVRWYAMSVMFPSDWKFNVEPSVIMQLHSSQKTTVISPPLGIAATNNDLNLGMAYNYRNMSGTGTDPANKANSGSQNVRLGKFTTNKWYCFVMQADWSHTPGVGAMKVWMNGALVFESKNAYNSYETWLGNYPKVGIYEPGKMSVPYRSIYTDFIYVGGPASTFESMAALTPCGTTPQPLPALIK